MNSDNVTWLATTDFVNFSHYVPKASSLLYSHDDFTFFALVMVSGQA